MWEYFNFIDPTPLHIIMWVLVLCLYFCIGGAAMTFMPIKNLKSWHPFLGGLIATVWGLFLQWLTMGKSFEWSERLGNWLRGVT